MAPRNTADYGPSNNNFNCAGSDFGSVSTQPLTSFELRACGVKVQNVGHIGDARASKALLHRGQKIRTIQNLVQLR